MTADQRLILKIEQAEAMVEEDQFLAAYHLLEEILRDLDAPLTAPGRPQKGASGEPHRPNRPANAPPLAAAG